MQYSVVNCKKVKENSDFRIDSEYYHPAILSRLDLLDNKSSDRLSKLVNFVVGPFGSTVTVDKYVDRSDYRYIRNKDINDFLISDDDPALIPEEVYKSLPQFHIQKNDLLLTVVGTLGKVAIAQEKDNKSIFSCKSTLLRSKGLNPYYLLTYLNSPTGQTFSLRGKRGAIQEGLNLTDLRDIKVFTPSSDFQKLIEKLVKRSFCLLNNSKSLNSQAEEILLSELELTDWKPRQELIFVKNYSDMQNAGRMDAEYFQPFYEEIEDKLSKFEQKSLNELCKLINYGTVPTSPYVEVGTPYIKGLNIIDGSISGKIDHIENTKSLPQKYFTTENDIVISQMGTVGKAGVVSKKEENYLFASFTIRVRLTNYDFIDPYVLTLFINKIARPYYLMRRIAQASVRQNTDLPTIKNLRVPRFNTKLQQSIRDDILKSKQSKHLSKSLIDIAKQGVEMAIEEGEEKATQWIKEQAEGSEV